jgi:hypothetical protein
VVHIVRAQDSPGDLLEEIVLFIRALGRDKDTNGIGSMLGLYLLQTVRHSI